MPVRIYDISKKLGLENKEVLSKAKELGIAAARVASSSLDKITAEYLEQQLILAYPERAAALAPAPAEAGAAPVEAPAAPSIPAGPILITSTPIEAPTVQAQEAPGTSGSATVVLEPPVEAPEPQVHAPAPPPVEVIAPKPPVAEPVPTPPAVEPVVVAKIAAPAPAPQPQIPVMPPPPPAPREPVGPKLGDKVGFIQLPPKPGPKPPEQRPGTSPVKPVTRPPEPRRNDFGKRGDIRSVRGPGAPSGPYVPGARFPGSAKPARKTRTRHSQNQSPGRCPGNHHQTAHRGA